MYDEIPDLNARTPLFLRCVPPCLHAGAVSARQFSSSKGGDGGSLW